MRIDAPSRREAFRAAVAILKRAPKRHAGAMALTALEGLVECAGVLLLVPLLAAFGIRASSGGIGVLDDLLIASQREPGLTASLAVVFAALVSVIAVHGFIRHKLQLYTTSLVESYKLGVRSGLFRALTRADWDFHLQSDPSRIVDTITTDVSIVGASVAQAMRVIQGLIHAVLYLVLALYLSATTTVLTLVIGAVWIAALRTPMRRARSSEDERSEAVRSVHAATFDLLDGMGAAKSHADEDRHVHRFEAAAARLSKAETEVGRSHGEERVLTTTGAAIASGVLVWAGVQFLGFELATLLVLAYVFGRLMGRLRSAERALRAVGVAAEASARVDTLLSEAVSAAEPATWRGAPTLSLGEVLRLANVSCTVSGRVVTASVRDVSLEVHAGRTTALMGPPGGGRDTVGQLIRGLLLPESGEISIDGRVLEGADFRGWRKGIGYVSRDVVFFEDTIQANLTDDERRVGEVQHALHAAQLDGFLASLPRGAETLLSRIGRELDDGERLRLALARALLRRPRLLVFDDTRATLDSQEEALIRRALARLHQAMTILIITDRPSLARDADLIYWIERGRKVESGTWTELMGAGGRLRSLAEAEQMEAAGIAG